MKKLESNVIEKVNKGLVKQGYSFIINKNTKQDFFVCPKEINDPYYSENFLMREENLEYGIIIFSKEGCIRNN